MALRGALPERQPGRIVSPMSRRSPRARACGAPPEAAEGRLQVADLDDCHSLLRASTVIAERRVQVDGRWPWPLG